MTQQDLENLIQEINTCKNCILWKTRISAVGGEGSHQATVMFIGEAPGKNEDLKGKPFVGRAGHVLDDLLKSIHLEREDVYITNIVKCRPPKNRNPLKGEIQSCSSYLERQLQLIKPRVIVTLGNYATSYILEKFGITPKPIGMLHGQILSIVASGYQGKVVSLYHPAAAVYNPPLKTVLLQDFTSILKALG